MKPFLCALFIAALIANNFPLFAQSGASHQKELSETINSEVAVPVAQATATFDADGEPDSVRVPFAGYDLTWQNGNDRRDHSVLQTKYFTGSFMFDGNYTYSFNNPKDNTVVGSTALARNNEMEVMYVGFGGDLNYKNARGRVMLQLGNRSIIVPRNDYSPYRGQYEIGNAYRYISEAYGGYHFNKWYGINVDFGMFMSYIGLNSYYQAENWEYQASFTSDNTPWFFNGMRGLMTNPGRYLVLYPTGDASPLPDSKDPTKTEGTHPFSTSPGDKFAGWDCSTNFDWMPNQSLTVRFEYVHRNANVPYFAGRGGVTSPTGYTTTPITGGWAPDLVNTEDRMILAILFRL